MPRMKSAGKKVATKAARANKNAAAEPASAKKTRRRRARGVRKIILGLLAKGPMTRAEIVKAGKISGAALYLHLKALRDEGVVAVDSVSHKLMLGSAAAEAADEGVEEAVAGDTEQAETLPALPVHVPRALHEALDAVLFRLSPIEHASEKILILEQLSRTTPKPVAEILRSLMEDVARLSALKAG